MRHNRLIEESVSFDAAIVDGRAFSANFEALGLANDATFSIGLITNTNPLIIFSWSLRSDLRNIRFELFDGGVFSSGSPVDALPSNRFKSMDPSLGDPFDTLSEGVTIDTPGTLRESIVIRPETVRVGPNETVKSIAAPENTSYMTVTNLGGAANDVGLTAKFAVYPGNQ